jgi:FtsH-binding integral membrane protein
MPCPTSTAGIILQNYIKVHISDTICSNLWYIIRLFVLNPDNQKLTPPSRQSLENRRNSIRDAEYGMIYLKSNKAAMKTKSKNVRIAFWVLLGVTISCVSLALNRPLSVTLKATATPTLLTTTTVIATAAARPDAVGSTDGIMLMGVVILLIVIVPILIRRQAWSNGKRKK